MTKELEYKDTATFVKLSSGPYANTKSPVAQVLVPVIFVQNTGFRRSNSQEAVDSDAVCWPDFTNEFIIANSNRLEGMLIIAPLYGESDEESWYKVIDVTVNRDHLLGNVIDNIELRLKKTRPIAGVS